MAATLEGRKANFGSITYNHSSIESGNLAKIGPLDVEITGLTEIVENKKQQQNIQPAVRGGNLYYRSLLMNDKTETMRPAQTL